MKLKVVHVQWVDSEAIGEWTELSEASHDLGVIHTVGLLVHQDTDSLLIASTYDGVREAVNAAIWIPRACVKAVTPLGQIEIKTTDI